MQYIYKITNLINSKSYIGKSKNPISRFHGHIKAADKNSKHIIHKAIKKYGPQNFTFEILDEAENFIIDELEFHYIQQYKTYIGFEDCNGYNMTLGGDGGDTVSNHPNKKEIYEKCSKTFKENESGWTNKKIPEEMKEKIRNTLKEYVFTEEHKKNISNSLKGRVFTEEHINNLKIANTGEKNPMFGKDPWCKGQTKETNEILMKMSEKISKTKKEKYKNGELIPWNKGKKIGPMSDEEKIKRCKVLYIIEDNNGNKIETRLIKKWLKENNLTMHEASKLFNITKEKINE